MGTKITRAQAYAFARGETVMVPATQLQLQQDMAVQGQVPARRASALDFMAVTDHAENIGVMASLDAPGSTFAQTPLGQRLIKQPAYAQFARVAAEMGIDPPLPAAWNNPQVVADAWEMEKRRRTTTTCPVFSPPSWRLNGRPCRARRICTAT